MCGDLFNASLGPIAFLPLIVFLALYVGCGITFTLMGAESPWQFPRHVALMPHDGGILIVTELAGCTPLDVLPYSFYMFALIIFICATIQFGLLRTPGEKAAAEKDPALR